MIKIFIILIYPYYVVFWSKNKWKQHCSRPNTHRIGTKYSQQGVLPRFVHTHTHAAKMHKHIAYYNAVCLLHASYLVLSLFRHFGELLLLLLFLLWMLLLPLCLAHFSVWFYDDQKSKAAFKRTGNVHAHIKTMRTQWQLSAPPLHRMTSCTYRYFTAITFYSYYRCSTFIFISHLFIYFFSFVAVVVRKKIMHFIDIGAAFCSFNLHRSLHMCSILWQRLAMCVCVCVSHGCCFNRERFFLSLVTTFYFWHVLIALRS